MTSEQKPGSARSSLDVPRISEILPQPERFPATRPSHAIGAFFGRLARVLSWVWLLLVGVIVLNVAMRYLLGEGRIEFEEIQWHLYSVGFLLGMSACMSANNHVRVDIFHEHLGLRARAWIELYGLLLLFFPFVLFVLVFSVPFVEYSFSTSEISDAPGGLPYRWAIKSVLPFAMLLLLLAGVARLLRVTCCLFGTPAELDRGPDDD